MTLPSTRIAHGRWLVHAAGVPCGEDVWSERRERAADGTETRVRTGVQVVRVPHPFPSTLAWRVTADEHSRVLALDLTWRVGDRVVRAEHKADGDHWRATLDSGGHVRTQQGDYPPGCVVTLGTHGVHTTMFRRLVLEPGAEHAMGALVVGPPWMAVEPGRQIVRCTRAEERDSPAGRVRARFVEVHDPDRPEAAWSAWLAPDDEVLESFEDTTGRTTWMRLDLWERANAAE